MDFQYQLVVTRAYEDGEEQLLEDDAECTCTFWTRCMLSTYVNLADDERVFLIDEALEFRFGSLDGDATFAWRDMSGDDGDLWEFVSSKVRSFIWRLTRPL